MEYQAFIAAIKADDTIFMRHDSYYDLNTRSWSKNHERHYIEVSWTTGGMTGGSCWGGELYAVKPDMPEELVDLDTDQGNKRFKEINAKAIEIDPATNKPRYEGIMLKEPNDGYERKRTDSWLKLKPVITLDLTVIGVEEGTGRNAGRMGALVFSGIDDGREITTNVGSGYSDSERVEYWENRELVLGCIGEVMADAITQNQNGTYSLRFPRMHRFRGFVPGEKM